MAVQTRDLVACERDHEDEGSPGCLELDSATGVEAWAGVVKLRLRSEVVAV